MPQLFNQSTNWIINRRWITVLLITVITVAAVAGHVMPERILAFLNPAADNERTQSGNVEAEEFDEPPDVNPFSFADANAILVVESAALFTPDGARALRHVVEQVAALPYVRSVMWMDRVPTLNIFGLPEPVLPKATASQQRFDQAREKGARQSAAAGALALSGCADAGDAREVRLLFCRIR